MKKWQIALIVFTIATLLAITVSCRPEGEEEAPPEKGVVATTHEYEDDGRPFTWPNLLGIVGLIGMVISLIATFWRDVMREYREAPIPHKFGLTVVTFFFLLFMVSTCIRVVPVTYVGVVRQVLPYTRYYVLGPGTHFVPPVVSTTHLYTTRVRPMKIFDIQADTNSVGRPEIYPDVVAWFRLPIIEGMELTLTQIPVQEDTMLTVDLRYGPKYEETFLKEKVVATVKEVSGAHPYDYFGNQRPEAQELIEEMLEKKLEGLVTIQDLTISFFNYPPAFEEKLAGLSMKQIELEQATKDVMIGEQRKLEAEKKALQRKAEGQGEKDYKILTAEGDAEALRMIAEQLRANPDLIPYEWIRKWSGAVPSTFFGGEGAPGFLFQIPTTVPEAPQEGR